MPGTVQDNTYGSAKSHMPKKCPQCGHMNPYMRETCRKCGADLGEKAVSLRCPVCGEDVLPTEKKCPSCGLSIEEVKARSQLSH